ncbi:MULTISPECIES: DUF4097 family beta strand repeat-containing protein [Paenibacillus]|uniref:DUF4097 family beta strand repeat-containing protein n=1 Tax=Paenibacillus TaxID=44249 RepID=UPI00041F26B7|nr:MULTISPECIES: DUF4097 family beta strand repeat-containing protein [Paenibacillus]KGP79508.1 hypothetical protein P364_0124415 [Paenibacillus sp. MAEPY2]KGP87885.1 hypothetical protein P363_0109530 [Paenibacillus sp. MAEPY1]
MSTKKWIALAILCIGIGLLGTSIYGVQFGDQREAYSKRWEFKNDELHNIIMNANFSADIEFVVSPDSNGYIEVDGKWDPATIEGFKQASIMDGTFTLNQKERSRLQFFTLYWNTQQQTITVALPEGHQLDDVSIVSTSSDLDLKGLHAKTLDLNNTSGSIHLQDINVPTIQLDLASGDIKATAIEGTMEVKQTSGSFTLDGMNGDVTRSVQSGDTKIMKLNGAANVKFTSGSVKIEQASSGSMDVSGQSGDISIQAAPDFEGIFDAQAISGDVNIPDSPMVSRDVIKARTTSGSIKIKQ